MKIKTIAWEDFFEIKRPTYVTFKIVPDSSVRNWRSEDLIKTLADQFKLPLERFSRQGRKISYETQERGAFQVVVSGGKIAFYLSVTSDIAPLIKRRILSVWAGATVIEQNAPIVDVERAAACELSYRKHHLYAIHTDAKDNLPLDSLFESARLIGEEESGRSFVLFEPIHQPTFQNELTETWRKLKAGHAAIRWKASKREIVTLTLVGITHFIREALIGLSEIIGGDGKNVYTETRDKRANVEAIAQASPSTRSKPQRQGIKVYLWTIGESNNPERARLISRALASVYGDLSGDNELSPVEIVKSRLSGVLAAVETKIPPKLFINSNLMSTPEAAKLVQLAGRELQEKFPEIERVDHKEIELSPRLIGSGLYLGDHTFKGVKQSVSFPKDNWDELCAPRIVIAGMGQGKTRGFAANYIVEAVRNGFGALAIDPAKGEIGDEVESALDPADVFRINLGETVFSLDWCEIKHSTRAKNRLANTVIDFFNANDETGGQTSRFIRAAVMAMQSGKLSEVLRIFEDKAYRKKVLEVLPDGIHKSTLKQFGEESEGRQRQILSPIYNRLDTILGDEFLEACLRSDTSLDMVEIMSQKKAVIIDVPKKDLGSTGVDLIVNLLTTKIDVAMTLRKEENQFPFFVLIDEPHQFVRSQYVWEKAAVESRKWRVGYVWLFHEWLQMSRELRRIIKSALPHYHFYPTSKEIWQDVREEIHPFTIEEALQLKTYHAINIIRSGGQPITPFIMKMASPPSKRRTLEPAL